MIIFSPVSDSNGNFNRGEHVMASFLDAKKVIDNIWRNGIIRVKEDHFLSSKIYPKAGVPQGSALSSLLFLVYVNNMPDPKHHWKSKFQSADDTGSWARSKNATLAAHRLQEDLYALAEWCTKCRINLNRGKTKLVIFSRSLKETTAKPALFLYSVQLLYFPHTTISLLSKNTLRTF